MVSKPEFVALLPLFSAERLQNLMDLTGSAEDAIVIHQDILRLGSALMTVTATVEIAIRNSVCDNLNNHFGVENWLSHPPVAFVWREPERKKIAMAIESARRARYAKMSQAQKGALDELAYPTGRPAGVSHLRRAKDRQRRIDVSHGKIVAELTLYFWKRLYGPEYEQALWRPTLKRTFPDKKLLRPEVAINLEKIYQTRNRLAHHEPVLRDRFDETVEAITFVVERLGQARVNSEAPLAILLKPDIEHVRRLADTLEAKLDKVTRKIVGS